LCAAFLSAAVYVLVILRLRGGADGSGRVRQYGTFSERLRKIDHSFRVAHAKNDQSTQNARSFPLATARNDCTFSRKRRRRARGA